MRTPSPSPARRRRVQAMAPEERRAALIDATLPLLREHGLAVSTRQIADAAGVAEGTIFGVFPDKASLLRAAILRALEANPLADQLAAMAPIPDLRERLRRTVELLRRGLSESAPLIHAARSLGTTAPGEAKEYFDRLMESRRRSIAAVAAMFEPDRARLRREPTTAARLLFMLIMANVHRGFDDSEAITDQDSAEIVSLLLDGLLVRPAEPSTGVPT